MSFYDYEMNYDNDEPVAVHGSNFEFTDYNKVYCNVSKPFSSYKFFDIKITCGSESEVCRFTPEEFEVFVKRCQTMIDKYKTNIDD